jgi:hypothetical protein
MDLNLIYGSGSLYRKIISPKIFDRRHLAEYHLTEKPFDQNTIWPNTVWPNVAWSKVHWPDCRLTEHRLRESSLYRKSQMLKTSQLTKMKLDWKFIWPKSHLSESSFSYFRILSFDRKFIWPNVFSKKFHLTKKKNLQKENQPWFSIRIRKAILIFESASDQNRAWLPRCFRRRQILYPRW